MQVVVTAIKIGLIWRSSWWPGWSGASGTPRPPCRRRPRGRTVAGFFAALVAALWAYDGWNNVSMVACEVRNPQRNLPLALIWGTAAVIAIYLATNAGLFLRAFGRREVARQQPRGGGDDAAECWARRARPRCRMAAMISIFAALNGSILSGSRVPYAMAARRLLLRPGGARPPRATARPASPFWR